MTRTADPARVLAIGNCGLCGSHSVCEDGLCAYCRETRAWSQVNRQFCALIHKHRPSPAAERRP